MRYQEVLADPLAHFFPVKVKSEGSFMCFAPPGLAPELQDLFLVSVKEGAGQKRKGREETGRASKKPRLEDEDEVEMPRERERSAAFSPIRDAFGVSGDGFQDESGFLPNDDLPIDDFQLQMDDSLHMDQIAAAGSRAQTPGDDLFVGGIGGDSRIGMFDTQMTQESQIFSSSQSPQKEKDGEERPEETANKDGYSRNTVKAIELLREELGEDQNKHLSFSKLTDKVSIPLR